MRELIDIFKPNDEIHEFMKQNEILEYQITSNGVDVQGNAYIGEEGSHLIELPFKFNEIHGDFSCSDVGLITLKNNPNVVHGDFSCSDNQLTSLEFIPKYLGKICFCMNNNIEPWGHRYLLFSEVQGKIFTDKNDLDRFFRKYQNKKALIPEALKELRELQKRWEQMNARTY